MNANAAQQEDKTSPAHRSSDVNAMKVWWDIVEPLLGGTLAMRAQGERLLPKWPSEEAASYRKRKDASTLFPAFRRTVISLASRPFSKPITIGDDVPETIKSMLDNVDRTGKNLDVFASECFKLMLSYGFGGIFVDAPKRPADARTMEDEKKLGLRPYAILIKSEQILGWRSKIEGDKMLLTQLRWMECVQEDDGDWATKEVQQVRVLEPGKWKVYRKGERSNKWEMHDEGTTSVSYIPFVPLYGERLGFMQAKPPLLELAQLNVKHWQQQSDQDNLMHVARVPILTARQVGKNFKLEIGGGGAVNLGDSPNAELNFVEHSGNAISAGKTQLDDLKEEMRQAGAELLVLRPGPATATEVASDNAVGMCVLQELALELEDALDLTLQMFADFTSQANGGTITLFKDFGAATLAEASASLLVGLKNSGGISGQTLFAELKRRGILSADLEWEEEQDRIESEGPSLPPEDPLGNRPSGKPVVKPGGKTGPQPVVKPGSKPAAK